MKALDPGYAAHIESGATTLATCWKLTRKDGAVLGFCDHDLPIRFGGADFLPMHGLEGGGETVKLGAQVDTGEVLGVLSAEAIAEEDILMGRYDGASVETWRVNWRNPGQRELKRRDTIGEIVREDGVFRAELRSAAQALNVRSGRVYHSLCDARLGDARCRVNLEMPAFRGEALVEAVRDDFHIVVSGLAGFEAGWFGFGEARWTGGRRMGVADAVLTHEREGAADILSFAGRVGAWVVEGDPVTVYAGCDRRFATCGQKFSNALNFRGFPHIPGSDYVLRHPRRGDALDGRPVVP
jgi:uncharacterized phage protein (TIGR02218 family)